MPCGKKSIFSAICLTHNSARERLQPPRAIDDIISLTFTRSTRLHTRRYISQTPVSLFIPARRCRRRLQTAAATGSPAAARTVWSCISVRPQIAGGVAADGRQMEQQTADRTTSSPPQGAGADTEGTRPPGAPANVSGDGGRARSRR